MDDTRIGGAARTFPTTMWSEILAIADPADPAHRDRINGLFARYWKPVFAYVRAAWSTRVEDTKDITQAFFAYLWEKGYLARLRPIGSFRGYLKHAVKHFVTDVKRAEAARRPARPIFPIDAALAPADTKLTPDRAYDRAWFRTVMDDSVEALRTTLPAAQFDVFRHYCLEGDVPDVTYRELGARLGLTEASVRHALEDSRARLKRILRERIREYVGADSEVEDELRKLVRA